MIIQIGQILFDLLFVVIDDGEKENIIIGVLFVGCKVVMFVVFGVFMFICLECYLFGYVVVFDVFCECGIEVYCFLVNDVFVMQVWVKVQFVLFGLKMFVDGNVEFICVFGLEFDGSVYGLGLCV